MMFQIDFWEKRGEGMRDCPWRIIGVATEQMDIHTTLIKLISKVWVDYCADFEKEALSIVNFCITDNLEQEYRKIPRTN